MRTEAVSNKDVSLQIEEWWDFGRGGKQGQGPAAPSPSKMLLRELPSALVADAARSPRRARRPSSCSFFISCCSSSHFFSNAWRFRSIICTARMVSRY